jgi:carboxyl-terminal processing protease
MALSNRSYRWVGCALFGLAVILVSRAETPIKTVKLEAPTELDSQIAKGAAQLLQAAHYKRHKIDAETSLRIHHQYLESWDPWKRYFMQSDIDEFAKFEKDHGEAIQKGNLDHAYSVFNRYRERLDQRMKWASELADAKHDLSKPDTVPLEPKATVYAKTEAEAKERWRAQVKYELASLIVDGVKEAEARDRLKKRYKNLQRYMAQVDKEELIERYLDALTTSYDPHSTYMSPRSVEQFQIDIRSSLEGVGALLGQEDGVTVIREIVPGGVIARDGRLKVGDKILSVAEGEDGDPVDIEGLRITQVVRKIRGKAGTKVKLEVQSANATTRTSVILTRDKIVLEDRRAKGEVVETAKNADGKTFKVGIVSLPSFYADDPRSGGEARSATIDVQKILEDFKKQNVDGVVMDLRNNGGGLLHEAIGVTGLFIDSGPVVQVKDFLNRIKVHEDTVAGAAYDGPLVVLVNKLSASASEIYAGAIQDYHRALVVGDSSTHGKGTVQQVIDIADQMPQQFPQGANAGALKVTLQMFYRVNGDSTQLEGVKSDIVLPAATDRDLFAESKLDYALKFDKIDPAKFNDSGLIDQALIKKLKTASQERRAKDSEFVKYAQVNAKRLELAERKTLTFTEETLKQQRKDLGNIDDEPGDDEKPEKKKKDPPKFGAEPYTREALAIVGDLVRDSKK